MLYERHARALTLWAVARALLGARARGVREQIERITWRRAHHAPLAEGVGLGPEQVRALTALTLGPLSDDHAFPVRPGFVLTPDGPEVLAR